MVIIVFLLIILALLPSSAKAQEDSEIVETWRPGGTPILKYDDVEKKDRELIRKQQLKSRKNSTNHTMVKNNDDFLKALSLNWHPNQFRDNAFVTVFTNSEGEISKIDLPTYHKEQSTELKELIESIKRTKFENSFGVFMHFDNSTAKRCQELFKATLGRGVRQKIKSLSLPCSPVSNLEQS